jgi:hypothetical protein
MALADYYGRAALAAVQVLEGFDEARFLAALSSKSVGITFDEHAAGPQGDALLDLSVRLLARLYPAIAIDGPAPAAAALRELAQRINPAIEFNKNAEVGIAVGRPRQPFAQTIYAGARGFDALLDDRSPRPLGKTANPLGAGAAACLAAAAVFRSVFELGEPNRALVFSTLEGDVVTGPSLAPRRRWRLAGEAVLLGVGAIGNAAAWALLRSPLEGRLHLVDGERIDLGNLQRYVLSERADVDAEKVAVPHSAEQSCLELIRHPQSLQDFLSCEGHYWEQFLLGLDSAADRCSAQAALPHWIANAWTQPGDLGCSVHPHFGGPGACVACLYVPQGPVPNEDEVVAAALGVPAQQMRVRTLLHTGEGVDQELLAAIASEHSQSLERFLPYAGRPIRELYVEGFCGGAILGVGAAGPRPRELHVPLAHQSALAGVLLATSLVRRTLGLDPLSTQVSKIDLLSPLGIGLSQPLRARGDGRCICEDTDFRLAYELKYDED